MKFEDYRKYIFPDNLEEPFNPDYDELSTWGLREFMVPLDIMMLQVPVIEGCNYITPSYTFYKMGTDGKLEAKSNSVGNVMSAEYSYSMPACNDYAGMNPQDLTEDVVSDWIKHINVRVGPIVKNAISDTSLQKFDLDDNASCFYHIFTGQLDFFRRSPEKDIQCFQYYTYMFQDMKKVTDALKQFKNCPEETDILEIPNIINWFVESINPEECELVYQLTLSDKPDVPLISKFDTMLPFSLAKYWSNYIIEMINRSAKVIVVP